MGPLFLHNLRNHITFPSFENLPEDSRPSPVYHTFLEINSRTGAIFPHVQWHLIAEVTDMTDVRRLRLNVKDASQPQRNFFIHAHTDDQGKYLASQCRRGHTLVVSHTERHLFLDGTTGIRLEQGDPVVVLPFPMKKLFEANERFFAGESKDMCTGCRTAVASEVGKFGKVSLSVFSAHYPSHLSQNDTVQIRKNCRSNDCKVLRKVPTSNTGIARHQVRFARKASRKARYLALISAGLGWYFWPRSSLETARL